MGVPASEVGYTSAMPRREDHEVRQGHVGHWIKKKNFHICTVHLATVIYYQLMHRTTVPYDLANFSKLTQYAP